MSLSFPCLSDLGVFLAISFEFNQQRGVVAMKQLNGCEGWSKVIGLGPG